MKTLMINLVEMVSGEDESKWNQSCIHGHLIEGHSVYCHYDGDKFDPPRKCRKNWFWGASCEDGDFDEDCPGYERNPDANPVYLKENLTQQKEE
jgi:hypothetical protein